MTTPWWQILELREEVRAGAGNINDVQMSLYRAVYDSPPAPYADPAYYGAITHPTATLAGLLARIAIRLGGGGRAESVPALYHLDQGMGGGKSHGLIGLWHLASHTDAFFATDIGRETANTISQRLGSAIPFRSAHVVVLSADNMTPFAPDDRPAFDGPAKSLWERFLWRVVGGDYAAFTHFKDRSDQDGIKSALASVGRPILILVDEIMEYVRRLDDARYAERRNEDLAFLKALLDAVNDVPNVAMVIVMIATHRDPAAYGPLATEVRGEILANLIRNGTTATVTEAGDFARIIGRRLFTVPAPDDILGATARLFTETTAPWQAILSRVPGADSTTFRAEVARAYPFHPDLLRLVEKEWANLAGYQRVRSTVTIFAQTAYHWLTRAEQGEVVPWLIGPGDLPLDNGDVREALLDSGVIESDTTVANYRQVIATDIVGERGQGGTAALLDQRARTEREPWCAVNPRAAQRMATALLLYSLTPRASGRLGATEIEIKAAAFVPDTKFPHTAAATLFNDLTNTERGLGALEITSGTGNPPARYYLTTLQTLHMLYRQQLGAVTATERDDAIAEVSKRELRSGGGFSRARFIADEPDGRGQRLADRDILGDIDESNQTRLVALDPRRWTLLNGGDPDTRQAIDMVFGIGDDPLPVTHAASLVIACANTQRRDQAKLRAAEYIAWTRVARIPVVATNNAQRDQAASNIDAAKAKLDQAVKRAFQHLAYLHRDGQGALTVIHDKFDEDTKHSLSGANVWEKLVAAGRAVGASGLAHDVLVSYVRDLLPRSPAEITAMFWTNPRLPMLSGVNEVRRALFGALTDRKLELVRGDGVIAALPERPEDVSINSPSDTLRLPQAAPPPPPPDLELLPLLVRTLDERRAITLADLAATYSVESPALANADTLRDTITEAVSTGRAELVDANGTIVTTPIAALDIHNPTITIRIPIDLPEREERAELRVRVRAAFADQAKREHILTLLRNLAQMARLDDFETVDLNITLIGAKEQLITLADIARRIEGTQPRIEDLPD